MVPTVLKTILPIAINEATRRLLPPAAPHPTPAQVDAVVRDVAHRPEVKAALDAKPLWASKTVWASLGIIGFSAASLFGYAIAAGDIHELSEHVDRIVTGVLGLLALYGRIVARQPLT